MHNRFKVSVLVPVWNLEELVVRALDSVPRRDDIEILICDDASTDGTAAAVSAWIAAHPDAYARLIRHPYNRGIGAARNSLFNEARGEYVASLDGDDWLYPDEFVKILDELDGTDIVYQAFRWNNGRETVMSPESKQKFCAVWIRFIRRAFLGRIRCAEVRVAEDRSLHQALEALPHSEKFTCHIGYHYNYPRSGSLFDLVQKGFDTRMYDNVFYYGHVGSIGGVETMFFEIARKYGSRDITILYKTGDPVQLKRLAKYVRVKRWRGERIRCRRAFFGYSHEALDRIEADECIQIIHVDYLALAPLGINPKTDARFSRYVAVSEIAAKGFEQLTGILPEVCYNPCTVTKPRKVLRLVSATRLTAEKGLRRMQALASALDAAGVRYVWTVFAPANAARIDSPNVIYVPARLDILDFIADADYLVQLSDAEGFCYSIVEALSAGTPVLVTPLPVLEELGVVDGVNAFVLPFDMSEIPVDAIVKGLKRFKYKAPADRWADLLIDGESTWQEERRNGVTVEATQRYRDIVLDRILEKGEQQTVTQERARTLEDLGLARIVY